MKPETIAAGLAFFQGKRVAVKMCDYEKFLELSLAGINASFDDRHEYKILPDLPWYSVALLKDGSKTWTTFVRSDGYETEVKNNPYFVGWLDERKTYDPEQVGK